MSAAISTAAKMAAADALLVRANYAIRANVSSLIECNSNLVSIEKAGETAEPVPVPGTIEPSAVVYIARLIHILRDIEVFIGNSLEVGPPWLDDLLARRNGWEDGI